MNIQTAVLSNKKTAVLTFVMLLAIASAAPLIGNQYITGPIVNATLVIATLMLGVQSALLIGMIPSCIALSTGLLPVVLAPQIPFIIIGNAILVLSVGYLSQKNYWLGLITGSVLKFAFLYSTVSILTGLIMNETVAAKISMIMSWPQLVTALAGGILAFIVIKGVDSARS